jgi:VWFA-related protein
MRHLPIAASTMLLCCIVLAADQQAPQFRANTDLVSVYATVLDADGRLVTDLSEDDFEVLDDGRRQPVSLFASGLQPITIVIMLDRSGSVTANYDLVRTAAERLVGNLLPEDRARIGSFSRHVQLDPVAFTSDQNELIRILRYNLQEGGPTPLWEAASAAMEALSREAGRRVILLFSDGKNSPQFSQLEVEFDDVRDRARREDVMVYAIGLATDCEAAPASSQPDVVFFQRRGRGGRIGGGRIGVRRPPRMPTIPGGVRLPPRGGALPPPIHAPARPGCRPSVPDPDLHQLAADGGGGYFVLDRTDDLGATFARVAEELHHQYLLAFQTPARDGRVHRLKVQVRRPGTSVRARTSYLAPAR